MRSPRPLVTAAIIWLVLAGVRPAGGAAAEAQSETAHPAKAANIASAPVAP